jgi:hypothetical protein
MPRVAMHIAPVKVVRKGMGMRTFVPVPNVKICDATGTTKIQTCAQKTVTVAIATNRRAKKMVLPGS